MPTAKRGGLSGKARKVRYRNRAARLHTREMINEYFEPVAMRSNAGRFVPIRSRSEFLPSVAHADRLHDATGQLELPLTENDKSPAQQSRPSRTDDRVIRFRRNTNKPASRDPRTFRFGAFGARRAGRDFTLRGFLVGCAMGSAAATLVLLVVHTAVG